MYRRNRQTTTDITRTNEKDSCFENPRTLDEPLLLFPHTHPRTSLRATRPSAAVRLIIMAAAFPSRLAPGIDKHPVVKRERGHSFDGVPFSRNSRHSREILCTCAMNLIAFDLYRCKTCGDRLGADMTEVSEKSQVVVE